MLFALAWWVIRKSKDTADDYFLAGRNLSWWIIGASIFASNIGSEHLVGLAGSGTTDGVAMAHYELHAWCLLVLAWILVERLPQWLPSRFGLPMGLLLAGIAVVGYGMKTWNRIPVWENALTLNSAAIKVSPNSARANTFMATALYQEYRATDDPEEQKKILGDMGIYIRRAVDIYPAYFSGLTMYVGVLAEEFRYDNDIDKLLAGFRRVFEHRDYLQFVDLKTFGEPGVELPQFP